MNFVKKWVAETGVFGGSIVPAGDWETVVSTRRAHQAPVWRLGWLGVLALSVVAPWEGAAGQTPLVSVTCPTSLGSCTANRVATTVTSAAVLPGEFCSGPNDTVNVSLTLSFSSTAANSYDVGLFVGTNGISPNTVGSTCSGQIGVIPPFLNTNANACGDVSNAGAISWPVTTSVKCIANASNQLTIPSCRVWYQNATGNATCSSITNVLNGTGSQCDCSTLTVPVNFIAFGTLTINKVLVPANDPGLFNLTIDGVTNATNVGNNGTTGAVTVNTGDHTVGEMPGTNTNLADYDTTISCTPGTGSTATVSVGQNTTCTITNTRKSTPVCRMVRLRSGGAVTPPGVALFGTGQLNGTCSGTSCSLAINTTDGMFNGKGLIYNDGQFPVSGSCNAATEECFQTQSTTLPSANPFPTTSPGFDLTGLTFTPGNFGGTITFTGPLTYTFTAGSKFSNHTGTYTTTDCAGTAPEPRTLALMLPLVLILLSWSALGLARRSRPRQQSG